MPSTRPAAERLFTYADGKSTPVKDVKPDDFWKALNKGACWMDDRGEIRSAPGKLETTRSCGPGRSAPLPSRW